MAQHDGVIDNGTGSAVRTDINNALAAINSNNSGGSDPSTTYAYQFYADTGDNTFKIRNAANDSFINISITGGLGTENFGLAPLSGATFTGNVSFPDDVGLRFGGSNDGIIQYYNSSDSFRMTTADGADIKIDSDDDLTIECDDDMLLISGDGIALKHGDLSSNENMIVCNADAAVELYHDNSKKIETTSSGVLVDNQIKMSDAGALVIGTDNDVNINHSGNHFQIHNDTGNIYLDTVGTHFIRVGSGNEAAIDAIADGAVNLYYDNSLKLATSSSGATVTGTLTATTFSGSGASLTNLPSAQLTGALPALDGSNLTNISAGGVGGNTGIDFNDDVAIRFGTGDDISLDFDSGQNAFIVHCSNAADIILDADDDLILRSDDEIQFQTTGTTTQAFFSSAGLELVNNNDGLGENGATPNTIKFHDTDTGASTNQVIGRLDFESSDTSGNGVISRIQGSTSSTTGGGQLQFYTAATSSTSLVEFLNVISNGRAYFTSGGIWMSGCDVNIQTNAVTGVGVGTGYALLEERQSTGTDGGTFTSGAWRTRIINTEVTDSDGYVSLNTSTGEFTLDSGIYLIHWSFAALDTNSHVTALCEDSDSDGNTIFAMGTSEQIDVSDPTTTHSTGWARIDTGSTGLGYFIKHRCDTTKATTGFGRMCDFTNQTHETYGWVMIWRENHT